MKFEATLDLSGLRQLARRLPEELGGAMVTGVTAAVREGAAEAKRSHRYKDQTGKLTAGISGELTYATRGEAEGEIVSRASYSSYVDAGTRPHEIRPKLGRAVVGPLRPSQTRSRAKETKPLLSWVGPDGRRLYAYVVHHPGTHAYGFMGQAYEKAERVLEREVDVATQRACDRVGD